MKVPTLVLLLNTSTGQAGQAASLTVKEYCSSQTTKHNDQTGGSAAGRDSTAKDSAASGEACAAECPQAQGQPHTSTNALVGSGSAVAVPVVELVAAAESRLSSGGVVSSEVLPPLVSLPFASTQITVTL